MKVGAGVARDCPLASRPGTARRGADRVGGSARRRKWRREVLAHRTHNAKHTQNAKSDNRTDEIASLRPYYLIASTQTLDPFSPREHPRATSSARTTSPLPRRLSVRFVVSVSVSVFFFDLIPLLVLFTLLPLTHPWPPSTSSWAGPQYFIGWSRKGSPARSGGLPFLESPDVERNLGQGWGSGLLISWDQPIEINT